ncbi:hypothetical protein FFZ96_16005 [Leptospira borgpetersenii]|nr:hypothetical protein FFZ96_16005 [Leptospira borgpetersenii]
MKSFRTSTNDFPNRHKRRGKNETRSFWKYFFDYFIGSRQNGAPSGLEKRGLDASIYHKTKKPTEGTQ